MEQKKKYRRRALIAIVVMVAIVTVFVFNRLNQLSKFGFCGNGPQVEYHVEPQSGQDYVLLTSENTGAILSNKMRTIKVLPEGTFVGYMDEEGLVSNLSFVTDHTIETCMVDGIGPVGLVNGILYDDGIIWDASDNHSVWKYQNYEWKQLTPKNSGLAHEDTYHLEESKGNVYVSSWDGLSVWGQTARWWSDVTTHNNPLLPNHIHAFLLDGESKWLGTISDGLIHVVNGVPTTFRVDEVVGWPSDLQVIPELGSNNIRVIRKGPDGLVWVGSDPGLASFDSTKGEWQSVTVSGESETFDVLDIEFAPKGQMWVTGSHGTYHITPIANGYSVDFYWDSGLSLELSTNGVFQNKVLIATNGSGLYIGPLR